MLTWQERAYVERLRVAAATASVLDSHVWNPETCLPIIYLVDLEDEAKARADAMEELMLEVNACEANWWLDDRLDLMWKSSPQE